MLDYKLLETLIAVITNSGFERAAINMGLTQSAVSQRIQLLEARLGQPVIIRTPKIEPTEIGKYLLTHIQKVNLLEQDLIYNIPNLSDKKNQIKIAIDQDSLLTWWPSATSRFIQKEKISFNLVVGDQEASLKRMKDGEVAGCICSSPSPLHGARSYFLGSIRYFPMATPAFINDFFPKGINYQSIKNACAIINDDNTDHKFFFDHYNYLDLCYKHTCTSTNGIISLIKEGIGYGILPGKINKEEIKIFDLKIIESTFKLEKKVYFHHWNSSGSIFQKLTSILDNYFKKAN